MCLAYTFTYGDFVIFSRLIVFNSEGMRLTSIGSFSLISIIWSSVLSLLFSTIIVGKGVLGRNSLFDSTESESLSSSSNVLNKSGCLPFSSDIVFLLFEGT